MTTHTAASRSAGSPATAAETASTPPAEAPRRMRSWPGIDVQWEQMQRRGIIAACLLLRARPDPVRGAGAWHRHEGEHRGTERRERQREVDGAEADGRLRH